MKLPKTNKRDSANAECKKFKPLTDREAEIYFIGLDWGFEQAKAMMHEKVKFHRLELLHLGFVEASETIRDLEGEL